MGDIQLPDEDVETLLLGLTYAHNQKHAAGDDELAKRFKTVAQKVARQTVAETEREGVE